MILCVGLTPTVQRTMFFDRFRTDAVNRARRTLVTASGKGVNVARVVTLLGGSARLITTLGGDSGRWIERQLDTEGISHRIVPADDDAPTRTCTTLLSGPPPDTEVTELVEEASRVEPHDASLLLSAALSALPEAKAVCLSGSLPPGVGDDFYARIVREAARFGIPCVVDAQKAPLALALNEKPFLVKPNREEAAVTLGLTLSGEPQADARLAVGALIDAGAQWALVSMGEHGSLLGNGESLWQIRPPRVEVVNGIGSGDSLAAGTISGFALRGLSVPDSAAFGTACAAANCLTPTSGVLHPKDVERLLPEVDLTALKTAGISAS